MSEERNHDRAPGSVQVSISMSAPVLAALDAMAGQERRTRSGMIRELIIMRQLSTGRKK